MRKALTILLTFASITCSLACDDSDAERSSKINNAAEKTGDALKTGAEKTGEFLDKAAKSTGNVVNDVSDKVSRTKVKVDVDVTTKPAPTTRPVVP